MIKLSSRFLTILILISSAHAADYSVGTADVLPTVTLDNGIVAVELNGQYPASVGYSHFPAITSLKILGQTWIPHDNAGADFQFSIRSAAGNSYNPTLEGDCRNNPSQLNAMLYNHTPEFSTQIYRGNWSPGSVNNALANGALLGVTPLLFYPQSDGVCTGIGSPAPYSMNFGVAVGDDSAVVRQAIILEMQIKKTNSASPDIVKRLSETPVLFGANGLLRYVYYSRDASTFSPATAYFPVGCSVGGVPACTTVTHDTTRWPVAGNVSAGYAVETPVTSIPASSTPTSTGTALPAAVVVMACDSNVPVIDATTITSGTCLAIYSGGLTAASISKRQGANMLTMMSMLGDSVGSATITDTNWHTMRRLVAVGTPGTVLAVIAQTRRHIDYLSAW